jgi:hypothetical protein
MTHHHAHLRELFFGILLVMADGLSAQTTASPVQRALADSEQGRYNEMTERYDLWQAEQGKFDGIFTRQLREANDNKGRDLCQQQHGEKVGTLRGLLSEQISAQKDYFEKKKKQAEDAIKRNQRIIGTAAEVSLQLNNELDNSRREMTFLLKQKDELLVSKRSLANVQSGVTPLSADSSSTPQKASERKVEAVDPRGTSGTVKEEEQRLQTSLTALEKAIKLLQDKIDTLRDAQGDSDEERRALLNAITNFKARSAEAQGWLNLIEAQRIYWTSYLDMRDAQLVELCGLDDMQPGRTSRKGK